MNKQAIGIFDSGVGGLTVAKAIKQLMPNERLIYFGDTLHLPYGEKSSHSINRYAEKITEYLLAENCKAIVIACNSASAHALQTVRELSPEHIPVINVIDPMAAFVKANYSQQSVGVIGTKATVRSGVYQDRLIDINFKVLETPLLATMVEEGFVNDSVSQSIINAYLNKSKLNNIDALVLGCTHYPLLKKDIQNFYKDRVDILDSSEIVAEQLKLELENKSLTNPHEAIEEDRFYVSDYTAFFEEVTSLFFGSEINLTELKIT